MDRPTRGSRIGKIAELLGTPLMPWQQYVVDVAGEYDDRTGIPYYREVRFTVPRQSGKTTVVLSCQCERGTRPERPRQRILYTAQTGRHARDKLVKEQMPLLESSPMRHFVDRLLRGVGNEQVLFVNGSYLCLEGNNVDSGHGPTTHFATLDEAFADTDNRREQAIIPSMSTVDDGQTLICTTAGDDTSVFWNAKQDQGRIIAQTDPGNGVAYFEWSADDDVDPDDREARYSYMPALGRTISQAVIDQARATMADEADYRRAYMNQRTGGKLQTIPPAQWERAAVLTESIDEGGWVFAVDADPDRTWASVAVANNTGQVEHVEHRPGTGWVHDRIVGLWDRWRRPVAIQGRGPLGGHIETLEAAGVEVVNYNGDRYANACMDFADALRDGTVKVKTSPGLDRAVGSVQKKFVGDRWTWARRSTAVDMSPLVAVTLARHAALAPAEDTSPANVVVWTM